MEIVKFVGIGVVGGMLALVLKQQKPELALVCSAATVALLFFLVLPQIGFIVRLIDNVTGRAGISAAQTGVLLRVTGIAYLAGFGADLCRDAGMAAVANKIELGGKLLILTLSAPLLLSLMETLLGLWP
jgi:stage III sporulation protein AD